MHSWAKTTKLVRTTTTYPPKPLKGLKVDAEVIKAKDTPAETPLAKYRKIMEDAGYTVTEETDTTIKGTMKHKDGTQSEWSLSFSEDQEEEVKKSVRDINITIDESINGLEKSITKKMDDLFHNMNRYFR